MTRTLTMVVLACVAIACSPSQTGTENDSTKVATDSAKLAAVDTQPVGNASTIKEGDEFAIQDSSGYITSPFAFSLDSMALTELLGPDVEINSIWTPAGEDELGGYQAYGKYDVTFGETKLSFYTYPGKHFADVYTPLLEFSNGVKVGMTKGDFLEAMGIEASDKSSKAWIFTINDDYGFMSFYFDDDGLLTSVYVSYEEGD